ncbi:MAG: G8 domain-containing protein [Bacteroidota bacterium]
MYLTTMKWPYALAIVLLFQIQHRVIGQQQNNLIVEKGEELLIRDNLQIDRMVIRGTVTIMDQQDLTLRFSSLLLDGGQLIAGTPSKPFKHQLSLILDATIGAIRVQNGGRLVLTGAATSALKLKKPVASEKLDSVKTYRNIRLEVLKGKSGYITSTENSTIQASGVAIDGFGTSAHAAIGIYDLSTANSYLKQSMVCNSKNIDLRLTNSTMVVENNSFLSTSYTSIKSFGGTNHTFPRFRKNSIINTAGKDSFAIVLENLNQEFTENKVFVQKRTNGISVLHRSEKKGTGFNKRANFTFDNNRIINLSSSDTTATIGLSIQDLQSKSLIKSTANHIQNFGIGAHVHSGNIMLSNYSFLNNRIGCIPGTAYIEKSSFRRETGKVKNGSKALWITDRFGKSAPKMSSISIQNHGQGLCFDGLVSAPNYFEAFHFEGTDPLAFSDIAPRSVIHDKDGSLLRIPNKTSSHHRMHGSSHHGHHMAKVTNIPQGYILYPSYSFLRYPNDKPLPNVGDMHYAPRNIVGTLTVATGMGLTDPVHEHHGQFDGVTLINSLGDSRTIKQKNNAIEVDLMADECYQLDFGEQPLPFFDFGFEWEAPSQKSIYIKMPYPHDTPVAMRSFGNQLFSVQDMDALKSSNVSTYYWDKSNKMVYLKMIAQDNFEEMVIYSSAIRTEITIDGIQVPLSMQRNENKDTLVFEYTVPKANSYSKFEVLDYYGNVVEKPFEGTIKGSKNTLEIALGDYDFKTKVYRYALIVGNQVHRGPIYPY